MMLTMEEFQFTHPVWGATCKCSALIKYKYCFNSRTPCGVRLRCYRYLGIHHKFQFTHPVWGATLLQRTTMT